VKHKKKPDRCSTVCSNIIIKRPFLVIVVFRLFVVWLVSIILGERVGNAFVEDFVNILWPRLSRSRGG